MNSLDPALLWAIGTYIIGVTFVAGYVRFQVQASVKANEELRSDLREHMKDEKATMTALLQRLDTILERQAINSERIAVVGEQVAGLRRP